MPTTEPATDLYTRIEEIIASEPNCVPDARRADLMQIVSRLEEAGLE